MQSSYPACPIRALAARDRAVLKTFPDGSVRILAKGLKLTCEYITVLCRRTPQ